MTPVSISDNSFSSSCARKLPDDINDGFVRPSLATTYGPVFDPEFGENGCLFEEIGGDEIYSNFVCGPLQSVKDFLSALDQHVAANWKREWAYLSEPPCILLALWEPPSQSSLFAMGASLVSGEGDDLMESFHSILKSFPDLILVACDGNDNHPELAAICAINGGDNFHLDGIDPFNFVLAAETVLRCSNPDIVSDIQEQNSSTLSEVFNFIHCRDEGSLFDQCADYSTGSLKRRI